MLYTLPTHNIQMQTPLCADIMSYYKKKKSPRLDLPIQQANGIDNYTLSTKYWTLSGRGCKVSGRRDSLVCSKRCSPRHDITTQAPLKSHNVHFCTFYHFICRTAMFINMDS